MAETLSGFQRKYLRGLAHGLKPIVLIGREGLAAGVIRAIHEGLQQHELIKIKFNECDDKDERAQLATEIATQTRREQVGAIGHTIILYRPQSDPERRKITVPGRRKTGAGK